jgi:hypothetical protein
MNLKFFFVFTKDEPEVLLGTDHGANPVEYALTALAGCVTTTLVYYAAAKGIKINKVCSNCLSRMCNYNSCLLCCSKWHKNKQSRINIRRRH